MTTLQIAKKFFQPAFALRAITTKAVIFSSVRTIYNLLSVLLIQKIIEYLQTGNLWWIQYWLLIYVWAFVVALLFFSQTYYWRWWNQIYEYDNYIQKKYLKTIMLIENTQFEKIGTGRFIGIIKSWSEARSDSLTNLSYEIPAFILSISYSLYLAYQLSFWFLLWYICVFALLLLFVVFINNRGLKNRKNLSEIKTWLSRHTVKMLMSKLEIIISWKLPAELWKAESYNKQLTENNISLSFYTFSTHEWPRSFLNLIKIILIWLLWYGYIAGWLPLSQVVWFLVVLGYVDERLQSFASTFKNTTKKFTDVQKLREFENHQSIWTSYHTGNHFTYANWSLRFENVSFGYNQSQNLFHDFSLELQGMKKTALVWPSWWGKSTLIKLIAGYLNPDEGNIIIDNQKLSETSLISYYRYIGYLTQDPSVFDGTIRDNLMYGVTAENAKQGIMDLDAVIKWAKCERIYELPDGLDTEIGERGVRLSWGQKQRLAIAKIMLKTPDIILLDEPTSALDSYNEEQVTQALNNLFKDKTVIVIAHRLQTVKHADDIIYIADWKVLERWTHEELLAMKWEYYKMVELQSGF